jgi:4-hydroxyphenylpyruvate dioxygenase-like putative hemolysin
MGSQARDEHIRRHKAGLISVLVNAPETAQQAEANFQDMLARRGCSAKYIAAHLEDARQRAVEGRKKLSRS